MSPTSLLKIAVWAMIVAGLGACTATPLETLTLKIVPDKKEDQITATIEKDRVVIDVVSPSGIGGASIDVTSGRLPPTLVTRLHLRGLEHFRFAYGDKAVTASLSSSGVLESFDDGEQREQPIAADSPYWMEVTVPARAGTPQVPVKDGTIDVTAPQDFSRGEYRTFTIQWIDFYR